MKIIASLLISIFIASSVAFGENPLPTDSSSSIFEKTAALYLIEEGKELYYQGRYYDALRKYREAYVRDKYNANAVYWIGKTHYILDNFGYALSYGKMAKNLSEKMNGDILFLLAQSHHRLNHLDSAATNYELAKIHLTRMKNKAYQVDKRIEEVAFADSVQAIESQFNKLLLDDNINSGYNDYAAILTKDAKELYFVSRRPDTKGGNINTSDQRYFEDVYKAKWNEEKNKWDKATNKIERLNSEGFDAINHISADGMTVYMTINTAVADVSNPTQSSDICVAEWTKKGRWSRPNSINNKLINTSYFDGAPTLTADGNTMYFVSDREGDKSKSDIYVVQKKGNNWGEAKKLPSIINSKENETTPFITPDGRFLFFSSEGHNGMGGYDIFVAENKGGAWTEAINLGNDFNTVNDDIFFKYYPTLKLAYLSTYRIIGKKSSVDIFEIPLEGWSIPTH